jgi:hypothetical protein
MLGGMADEDLGGPGYAKVGGVGVQVEDDPRRRQRPVEAALPPRHRSGRRRARRCPQDHGRLTCDNMTSSQRPLVIAKR